MGLKSISGLRNRFRKFTTWRKQHRFLLPLFRVGVLRKLHRLTPVSTAFGFDRGQPIDRYYIENFLQKHASDIRGRVLEVADETYSHQFGGTQVTQFDVLHAVAGNPQATLIGDLSTGEGIPGDSFDCMILTQTLHVIYDVHNTVVQMHRALTPGGVLLLTAPGISQISRYDMDRWGDFWRFTDLSIQRLFTEVFGTGNVTVEVYGNVFAAVAFLHGIASHELKHAELDYRDRDYQVTLGVRAVKK
jgi:SAM-dependent methyltransferase